MINDKFLNSFLSGFQPSIVLVLTIFTYSFIKLLNFTIYSSTMGRGKTFVSLFVKEERMDDNVMKSVGKKISVVYLFWRYVFKSVGFPRR